MQGHGKRKEINNLGFIKRAIIFLRYGMIMEKFIIIIIVRSLRYAQIIYTPRNDVLRLPKHFGYYIPTKCKEK